MYKDTQYWKSTEETSNINHTLGEELGGWGQEWMGEVSLQTLLHFLNFEPWDGSNDKCINIS